MNRNELAAQTLVYALRTAKVGVVAYGLEVDVDEVVRLTSQGLIATLHVVAVGYKTKKHKSHIEHAVEWRNHRDYAGRIVVFVRDDVPKLH